MVWVGGIKRPQPEALKREIFHGSCFLPGMGNMGRLKAADFVYRIGAGFWKESDVGWKGLKA